MPPLLLTLLTAAAVVAAASGVPSDVCKAVSAAYASKGLDVLQVQYQPSAAHLRVCAQRRPTCCTRAMEDALQAKAKVETYQMLYQQLVPRSTALASLATSLQSLFLHMLNVSHQELDISLKSIYGYSYIENKQPFTVFFDKLRAYLRGGPDTIAEVTRSLFESIVARVYALIMTNYEIGEQYLACVKQQMTLLRPLGQMPDRVGQEFTRAFVTARRFLIGLAALQDAVESAPAVRLSEQCQTARLRAQYCAWCDGHAGLHPCYGLCSGVIAECLAQLAALSEPFDQLVVELSRLAEKVEGANNLYQVLHHVGLRISGGIMEMQEQKENFQAQVAKACGQPRLKAAAGGNPGLQPLPPSGGARRNRRSADMFGWEYRGKDEPVAKGDQQERLTQLVRAARQELTTVRGLFRWESLARANCQPDPSPSPPGRCWNGTDPIVAASGPAPASVAPSAAESPDPATAERAANLRAAHLLAAQLPRSDNFVDFRESRLDPGLGRLLKKRPLSGGGGGGGAPAVITDARPGGAAASAGVGSSGSGLAPPPVPARPPAEPQPGGPQRPTPLVLSTLPPQRPRQPQQPTQPPPVPKQPDVEVDAAGSGDASPPPMPPATPAAATVRPPEPLIPTTTRPPPPPPTAPPTRPPQPPQPPVDLAGSGGSEPVPSEGPAISQPTPGGPVVDIGGAGGVASGAGEPTESAPQQPSRQPSPPPQPPFEPPGGGGGGVSGDAQPPGPPGGHWSPPPPVPPMATVWPPLPPPPETPPLPPDRSGGQQPPPPPQPDPNADLWLPKEPNEQGGAERNRGEGSIHSPMKMTDAKRACVGPSCPACRPVAASAAALLLAAFCQRLLLLLR